MLLSNLRYPRRPKHAEIFYACRGDLSMLKYFTHVRHKLHRSFFSIVRSLCDLLAAGCGSFLVFSYVLSNCCVVGPVWHCNNLDGRVGAGYFDCY